MKVFKFPGMEALSEIPESALLTFISEGEEAKIDFIDGKLDYVGTVPISESATLFFEALMAQIPDLHASRFGMLNAVEAYDLRQRAEKAEALLEAALSTSHTRVRHKKRGTTYAVIANGRLQVDGDLDNEKVTVYRGDDGQVWVRPDYEFNDGRFEPAAPADENPQ